MFQRAWVPAIAMATQLVGPEDAERVTVEAFAHTLERWHRFARRPDPDGKALGRTAEGAVRLAKRQGTSVPRRAGTVPDALDGPRAGLLPAARPTVDAALRAGLVAMPTRVAVAFVLHHVGRCEDIAVASATGTSVRQARKRAARGASILRREVGPGAHELLSA
jgi:DNA-directed RNA polymerase specialized sigma24 family protein